MASHGEDHGFESACKIFKMFSYLRVTIMATIRLGLVFSYIFCKIAPDLYLTLAALIALGLVLGTYIIYGKVDKATLKQLYS